MKKRYRQIKRHGKWILVEITVGPNGRPKCPDIMPDIEPYTSMIDGSTITSRSQHRAHLRQHNCVEVGNETDKMFTAYDRIPDTLSRSRKESIVSQLRDIPEKEVKQMVKRAVQQARGH